MPYPALQVTRDVSRLGMRRPQIRRDASFVLLGADHCGSSAVMVLRSSLYCSQENKHPAHTHTPHPSGCAVGTGTPESWGISGPTKSPKKQSCRLMGWEGYEAGGDSEFGPRVPKGAGGYLLLVGLGSFCEALRSSDTIIF